MGKSIAYRQMQIQAFSILSLFFIFSYFSHSDFFGKKKHVNDVQKLSKLIQNSFFGLHKHRSKFSTAWIVCNMLYIFFQLSSTKMSCNFIM